MKRKGSIFNLKPKFDSWLNAPVWVMLVPPEGLWEKAVVTSRIQPEDDSEWIFTVTMDSDESSHIIKTFKTDESALEFQWVKKRDPDPNNYYKISDMTSLTYLNEAEMIECMRVRFHDKNIYTDTGPILMAMNPFERLPLYDIDSFYKYYTEGASDPHVYKMSDRAYRKMFLDKFDPDKRENQTILVNGESGAGKTEATKQVLKYLSFVSRDITNKLNLSDSMDDDIEAQIISSNPITESFGNAKTSRNNNSSRFGKFIELGYSPDGYIEGARIRTYLLETARLAKQFSGERNYHIFYEIDAGLPAKQKAEYGLTTLKDFFYTNQSGEYNRHDDENDFDNYSRLRDAMTTLKIPDHFQELIVKILVGILHMGNLIFVESEVAGEEAASFSPSVDLVVKQICALLGLTAESLLTAVARRSVIIAGSEIQKVLNVEAATFARDTFAKLIYDLLFKWTVEQVNVSLTSAINGDSASFIGVLDIFGFEFFAKNSFEQLCINYTNEKLQDHFNYAIFKSEQEVYKEEGLKWSFVDYPDNSARLELLENKTIGVFALCDEQLKVPKCSDEKFAKTLYDKCGKHKFFSASKSEQAKYEFTIKHFACDVKYQAATFLDKNRSEMAKEMIECVARAENELMKQLINFDSTAKVNRGLPNKPGATIGKKASATVAAAFSKQLTDLVAKIRTTRSHFIRCIKPNSEMKPNIFNQTMVLKQLRCGGALGAVQVFRAGFPNRMDSKAFVSRFGCIGFSSGKNLMTKDLDFIFKQARTSGSSADWITAASRLIDCVATSEYVLNQAEHEIGRGNVGPKTDLRAGLQMGRTQVFMKAEAYEHMERIRVRAINVFVLRLQHRYRTHKTMFAVKIGSPTRRRSMEESMLYFTEYHRGNAVTKVRNAVFIQRRVRVFLAIRHRKRARFLVTKLASLYRGWKDRVYVRKLRAEWLVKLIQPLARGWLARIKVAKMRLAEEESRLRAELLSIATVAEASKLTLKVPTPTISPRPEKEVLLPSPSMRFKDLSQPPPLISSDELRLLEVRVKELQSENTKIPGLLDKIEQLEKGGISINGEHKCAYQKQSEELDRKLKEVLEENQQLSELKGKLSSLEDEKLLIEKSLRERLNDAEETIAYIQEEKKTAQAENNVLRMQTSRLEEERNSARSELAYTTADLSSLHDQLEFMKMDIQKYKSDVQSRNEKIVALNDIISKEKDEKNAVMESLQNQEHLYGELLLEKQSAEKLSNANQEEIAKLHAALSTSESEILSLKSDNELQSNKNKSLEDAVKNLKIEMEDWITKYKQTIVEGDIARELCTKLEAQVLSLENHRVFLGAERDALVESNNTLQRQLQGVEEETDGTMRKLRVDYEEMQETFLKTKSQLRSVEGDRDALQQLLESEKMKLVSFESKITADELEKNVIKSELLHMKSECANSREQITALENQNLALHEKTMVLHVELASLRSEKDAIEGDRNNLKTTLQSLRSEFLASKSTVSELEMELSIKTRELTRVKEENSSFETRIKTIMEEYEASLKEVQKVKSEITSLRKQQSTITEEKEKILSTNLQIRAETSSFQSQLSILEQERDDAKAAAQNARATMTKMEASISEMIESKTSAQFKEILNLQNRISTLEQEREFLLLETKRANEQIQSIQLQMQVVLDAQSQKSQTEIEVARKHIELLQIKVNNLETTIKESTNQTLSSTTLIIRENLDSAMEESSFMTADEDGALIPVDGSDPLAYLRAQVLLLGEQRNKSKLVVSKLRDRILAMKEKGEVLRSVQNTELVTCNEEL